MTRRLFLAQIALCALLLAAGCTQRMADQPRCAPYGATTAFDDGSCDRPVPPNTRARASVADFFAQRAGVAPQPTLGPADAGGMPMAITSDLLAVGQDRFTTFCAPCHGMSGYGDGMIVQRGMPAPPSFHSERLRNVPPEYIVGVITNGFGVMYSYADRVPEDERWAIAAYIKALQLSQDAPADAQAGQEVAP